MDTNNPYQTPKSDLLTRDTANEETLKIAKGQKKVIYAILVNILAYILQIYIGQIAALVNLFAIGLSTAGLIQMSKGMKYSTTAIILLVVLFYSGNKPPRAASYQWESNILSTKTWVYSRPVGRKNVREFQLNIKNLNQAHSISILKSKTS